MSDTYDPMKCQFDLTSVRLWHSKKGQALREVALVGALVIMLPD